MLHRQMALMRWVGATILVCAPLAVFAAPAPVYDQDVGAFASAKGERALVMGYPNALEIWAYPVQLVSDYRIRFRPPGALDAVDAAPLLRRVERTSTEVVRTYVGPDYTVREIWFVPRTRAGAVLRYEVEGRPDLKIEASFLPSLNLMWPGSMGGQTVAWIEARHGYVEREPLNRFSATIASQEAVDHDAIANRTRPETDRLAMLLQPMRAGGGIRSATVVFALDAGTGADGAAAMRADEAGAHADAQAHADDVLARSLEIDTPDPAINRALASATLALDQSWACNTDLGCGELAGFGPSRAGRRPQYAWFFGGDGLIATDAMLDADQVDRARDELAFVTRYQDPKTGMIWHEMSQSAGLIDWTHRYPYMYVHVDISFQYLATMKHYLATTGDTGFVRRNWPAIEKVWRYCSSVVDPKNGLPHIPDGKQGQNEQDRLRDDIRLSSLWIDAADGFAKLAGDTGHRAQADAARRAAARARRAIAQSDWDAERGFWISGHTLAGAAVPSQRSDALGVLDQGVFARDQVDQALDRIASPDFLTDWGVRSLAASDGGYDPNLYSAGSVWALGSASAATVFWKQHRPLAAWRIWRALIDWNRIDSAGHIPELLAGDLYHLEREAVPEQTWSSAGLLASAVHGLLGLEVDATAGTLALAPHLPAGMNDIAVRRVRVGNTSLGLTIHRSPDGIDLIVDNPGSMVRITFDPAIPLGATLDGATVGGLAATVTAEHYSQDEQARLAFSAGTGRTMVHIGTHGGILLDPAWADPQLGATSHMTIIGEAGLSGRTLTIAGWAADGYPAEIELATGDALTMQSGGLLTTISPGRYRLASIGGDGTPPGALGYHPFAIVLDTTSVPPQ